ncbi:MAG: DUF2225 domain-containing protein [Lachnospira sp.]|nr:DUF2225 domain-containing protein [Lachnospira sp.]
MGIFSGLEKFGFIQNENIEIYDTGKSADKQDQKEEQSHLDSNVEEKDLLFDKSHVCPLCDASFTTRTVKTGKAKIISHDSDLRPKYSHIDVLKYDAIVCPECGFAAMSRYFKPVSPTQAKWIREQISSNFQSFSIPKDTYSYDDAIAMHKLALMSTIVKHGKVSERAYCCLKLAWLNRGKWEECQDEDEKKQIKQEELELIEKAFEGFSDAFSKEGFPMCGMDELTVTFLVADLARQLKKFDTALQWSYKVISSMNANERIKDKARMLKDQIFEEQKQMGE